MLQLGVGCSGDGLQPREHGYHLLPEWVALACLLALRGISCGQHNGRPLRGAIFHSLRREE